MDENVTNSSSEREGTAWRSLKEFRDFDFLPLCFQSLMHKREVPLGTVHVPKISNARSVIDSNGQLVASLADREHQPLES